MANTGNFPARSDDLFNVTPPKPPYKTAQQRLVEQRAAAAAARDSASRRKKLMIAIIPVVVVVAIVAVLVVVKVTTGAGGPKSGPAASAAVDSVVGEATSVPLSVFNAVGVGSASAFPVSAGDAPALTANGLPRVFYAGAEYCPYCAAERWAVVVALSRFGTWSNLGQTRSSASDVFPSTATFSFHGASFTGTAVAFNGYELQSNTVVNGQYQTLETLSAADQALMNKYDAAPYFNSPGAIPFIDIGGKYLISGASYSPQVLAGKDQAQIAAALSDPTSDIAKAIIGTANVITAAVCKIANNPSAAGCTSSGVLAAAAKLPAVS
jgi:hypothetical protein